MNPSAAPEKATPSQSHNNILVDSLQPALRSALSSLNVQLDHELARYRYAKRGDALPTQVPPLKPRRRSPELMGNRSSASVKPAPRKAVTPPPPPPNPRLKREMQSPSITPVSAGEAIAHSDSTATPPSEVAALRSALVRQPVPAPDEYMASSEALLENFTQPYAGQVPETITQPPEPHWTERLNTPLGLGALILLLVVSAGFGFVLVNPSAVRHLVDQTPLARIWPTSTEETNEADDLSSAEGTDETPPLAGKPPTPLSPDLSQKEFTNLDFNHLSTLPSGSIQSNSALENPDADEADGQENVSANNPAENTPSSPSTATVPNAVPSTSVPTTTIPRPVTAPPANTTTSSSPNVATPSSTGASPSQPTATSEPAPESVSPVTQEAPPAVITESAENTQPTNPYYVVTDYTGDPSLEAARTQVEDAYLRNFEDGSFIQMGAFSSAEAANNLVEDLQQQGISAEVYEP
ncbi:MAG: hypothetical protein F6K42_05410 [Leptolyngbya sp. SIO1D8]|nr:hypothetical protein [Leptolyngbya sp. SIO1D8]